MSDGKTIIFCADGTWNGPNSDDDQDGVPDNTNVLKLFVSLSGQESLADWRKADEQEKECRDKDGKLSQIAKYLHGVGDSKNFLSKILGGAFGAGTITRIVRGYTFLSRNYVEGDRIVLVGFSRGAYTVRALAGLISDLGLLSNHDGVLRDKENAYRLGLSAWYQHRAKNAQVKFELEENDSLLQKLAKIAEGLPALSSPPLPSAAYRAASIEAVGVWDTVGALGIPHYVDNAPVDHFQFANCILSAKVKYGFHAVSIDEQRSDFTPTLWDEDRRVTQVLFAGAHADVGGGYPASESALSDCALKWMMQSLKDARVSYSNPPPFQLAEDPAGGAHRPWDDALFAVLKKGDRILRPGLKVHYSVTQRLARQAVPQYGIAEPLPYRPASMRAYVDDYWVLKKTVEVVG